jgi:hypothetical protein
MLSTEALRLGVRKSSNAPSGELSEEGNVILDYFYLFVLQIQSGSTIAEPKPENKRNSVSFPWAHDAAKAMTARPLIMEKKIILDAIFRVLNA